MRFSDLKYVIQRAFASYTILANGVRFYPLTVAVTANVTTTTAPAGSIAITSHATGRGTPFYSDGSHWQVWVTGATTKASGAEVDTGTDDAKFVTAKAIEDSAYAKTTAITLAALSISSTAVEIDQLNDVSAYQESVAAAGALSVTKVYSGLALVGAGAVTLAAPSATMLGQIKTIEMTADNGDVTLSLANVVGQSSGTTATFNDVGDKLILLAAASKWVVIKEFGVTLS
jgi:hypothetical protein